MNILLVCGSGASTGFLVQSMRKAAKKRGMDVEINARSESLLEAYISEIDVLLVGPHMRFDEAHIKEVAESHHVPFAFIDKSVYGALDGESALNTALNLVENRI